MNGAIAELCAKTMRAPITRRAASMGTSHHLLLLQKKANNSPTIPKRLAAVRAALAMLMFFLPPDLTASRLPFCCLPDGRAHNLQSPGPRVHCRADRGGPRRHITVLAPNRTGWQEKQHSRDWRHSRLPLDRH